MNRRDIVFKLDDAKVEMTTLDEQSWNKIKQLVGAMADGVREAGGEAGVVVYSERFEEL